LITLVLGGTRSGKSEVAEALLAEVLVANDANTVTYVATGQVTDDDMAARVAAHRARRPAEWTTVEPGRDLARALGAAPGHAIVDSLGTWVAAHDDLAPDIPGLCRVLRGRSDAGGAGRDAGAGADTGTAGRRRHTVVVSEEVGLGVHAESEVGRRFADVLGELNRAVADEADRVLLVVAGRVLPLERIRPAAGGGR
jgi:adenosyl cobinamide kinase/adenosyl cobinamide phosphate guanylyltransferase